jgi:heptosyltransferase III
MPLRRNILLFHQGALGDFVLTWPVAIALARIHPQSRVFYVTNSQKGRLAERTLGVEWADAEAGWHSLFTEDGTLPDAPGRLLAGAHSIVSFLAPANGPWAANVRRLAPEANLLVINPKPPADYAGHVTEFQREQLRPWPAAHAAIEEILRSIHTRGISVARSAQTDHIVIHPGSGSPGKNWPIDRYLELIQQLRNTGQPVRVLLGEVEEERWGADVPARLGAIASVGRPNTYLELLAELLSGLAFIGNDSGPGHLAGISGVPTLSLFGASDPARYKPLGPRVRIVRAGTIEELEVDTVRHAVRALMEP